MAPEPGCPSWCVAEHGDQAGEEDWVHLGAPLAIAEGVVARLIMSKDPGTGEQDGPYVAVGEREYTLPEAEDLGWALAGIARTGR